MRVLDTIRLAVDVSALLSGFDSRRSGCRATGLEHFPYP